MASIQTGIQLNDQFTGVLYGIINSVNLAVSAMDEMNQTMNQPIDTNMLDGAVEQISQATMLANEYADTLDRMNQSSPAPSLPSIPQTPESVRWQSDNVEVFNSSGVERYQQEIQSANAMLNQLSDTQNDISRQAANSTVLSPNAQRDMTNLAVRIDSVKNRIQQIESNPINIGTDHANTELEQLRGQLNQAVQEQTELNQAMQNMDVSAANSAYMRLSQTVSNTERYIRDNVDEQGKFNQAIEQGNNKANGLVQMIHKAVAAYATVETVKAAINTSDELVQTTSRLNLMNDGLQSTEDLVNMAYVAAQDARGEFGAMASTIARFGNNAKDAFGSSAEVVQFANLVQKQMTIAGASTQESSNAMLQLSQALGSGVLRGDELNSIFEQAPNLIQNIADYLGVSIGKIRGMAADGELSADIVKNAIFAAADDINNKFDTMPMTWGQVWTSFQNTAIMAFRPVLQRINDIANSQGFQVFVNNAVNGMVMLADVLLDIFDLAGTVGSFVADNWSIISPIVYGVIAMLAVYATYLGIIRGMEIASAVASGAMAVGKGLLAAATVIATGATWAETTAQMGLNSAMYACPIVWIIMLIIALIAIIYAVCSAIAEVTGVADSGLGVICGGLSVAGTFILNTIIGLINTIIIWIVNFFNMLGNFAAAFGIIFDDPVAGIKALFLSLFNYIVGVVSGAAKLLDTIFGSNLAVSVSGFQDKIQAQIDATVENAGGKKASNLDPANYTLDRAEYSEAWNDGVKWGDGVSSKIKDVFSSPATKLPNANDYANALANGNNNTAATAANTAKTADSAEKAAKSLDIANEDLKYLRDIAERDVVNRYTTASINVTAPVNATINNDMDLDGVAEHLRTTIEEEMNAAAEGVH